jgi:hypothetical protein
MAPLGAIFSAVEKLVEYLGKAMPEERVAHYLQHRLAVKVPFYRSLF